VEVTNRAGIRRPARNPDAARPAHEAMADIRPEPGPAAVRLRRDHPLLLPELGRMRVCHAPKLNVEQFVLQDVRQHLPREVRPVERTIQSYRRSPLPELRRDPDA